MEEQPPTAPAEDIEEITEGVNAMNVAKSTPATATPDAPTLQSNGYTREIRTLDGAIVEDEFDEDAMNYQILLEKLDALLERLNLDA
jgi:hypothetical protein